KAEEKMQKTLHVLASDFAAVRAGRANPAVLDKLTVDYYGAPTPIQQLAAVSVPEARILMIQPWDKSSLKAIEKAILVSDIGINPNNDGSSIRLMFPPLTAERRNDLAKEIAKMGEESKVALRSIRRDVIDKIKAMKKAGTLTEDDVKDGEKEVQKLTDKYVKEIDAMVDKKKKEIQEI
ncbi:MAG: ribosome recycling factor, partial [Oscillospiraceae bacterium]|nr:ribosome recycling factor [Oscillospiraceae bacterium]